MRNLIVNFPAKQKQPVSGSITLASGTFTDVGAGTYTLTDNAGVSVASGSVTGHSTAGLTLTEFVTLDGQALSLAPGVYVLDLLLNVTPSDTVERNEAISLLLSVPGVQADRTYYPTGDDLQVFLAGAGLISNPPTSEQYFLDLDGAVKAAVDEWERLTRRTPFLNTGTITTRQVRVSSGIGLLEGGLISVDSGADAVSVNGVNYTLGTNAQLLPIDAQSKGRPYEAIRFGIVNNSGLFPGEVLGYDGYGFGTWQSLAGGNYEYVNVRGQWGYSLTVPADVKEAILNYAAFLLAPQIALSISGGVYTTQRLTYSVRYGGAGATPLSAEGALWKAVFDRAVKRYLALRIG